MTVPTRPDCLSCIHYNDFDEEQEAVTCAAFPQGIPADIYFEAVPHREPRNGDGGITFAQDPEKPPVDPLPAL